MTQNKVNTATLILNRNLPKVTDKLKRLIEKYNSKYTDIYIIDSGSEKKFKSKYTNFNFETISVKKKGLRFSRGMNYGLSKLYELNKFKDYKYFLLLTNDTVVPKAGFIKKLENIMNENHKVGILSPCSKNWGERKILKNSKLLYFWYIHNNAYYLRKELILDIKSKKKPSYLNFFFDGTNFRGYGAESEIIAKGYINGWSSAITSEVIVEENEKYLLEKSELIKTEPYDKNLKLYINEGHKWMKRKYGFKSKWDMQMYVKSLYDQFFKLYPDQIKFKI